jgi:saccharopine dehydrogenase (NAD+, L-glutamate forming)
MSKKILVIGAGRSSTSLLRYLLGNAEKEDWTLRVGEQDVAMAEKKVKGNDRAEAFAFNALDERERESAIKNADLIISMLPARFHTLVAKDCIRLKKNVITPSYVSPEMKAMHQDAVDAGVLIMNEIGVDPGIDHMSAMKIIHQIEREGGEMKRFESFTGGLVAPESDDNPWNYKFSWNPRNVVLAGQGGSAKFIEEGKYKYVPYHRLFERTRPISIEGHGEFEGYANRDSLSYRSIYGLENVLTLFRGTLRKKGFSRSWNAFVQLGMTDDSYKIKNSEDLTWRQFVNLFLPFDETLTVEEKVLRYLDDIDESDLSKIEWLGFLDEEKTGLADASPAQLMQKKMEERMSLKSGEKDMIVMWHRFNYEQNGEEREIHSSLVAIGEDDNFTAMSETVGLPVGICAKLMLRGEFDLKGVVQPIMPEVYEPVLKELEDHGIRFEEREIKGTNA